ncbi:helix-turn-helix domain-containing protein [Nocardia sp. MDA0666]|uniref:helix-turn-helix domain-containing protein n=1 Tax=Nocardia sp. MDA0666 TaxID=2135448 RepID=UPI0011B2638A|nr:helix-turn-helix domain-containing protein [Nocardia sp. MDA0666]
MTGSDAHPMCSCGCGRPGDQGHGMCKAAYSRHRRRQLAYGRWQPRVAPDTARAHIDQLLAAGLKPKHVAELAGISHSTMTNLARPETEHINAKTEQAILAVAVPERAGDVAADTALVPITGARRRIQALIAYGYPQTRLAHELGIKPSHATMAALVERALPEGHTGQSLPASRDRDIKALFGRLQMTPGPSEQARAYGRDRGWALPFEWDEDALDDPNAQPDRDEWQPPSEQELRQVRRAQVAELSARGRSASQIAEQLHVTKRTVVRDRQFASVQFTPARGPIQPELDWGLDQ